MIFYDISNADARKLSRYHELPWPIDPDQKTDLPGGAKLFRYRSQDKHAVYSLTRDGSDLPPTLVIATTEADGRQRLRFKKPRKQNKEKKSAGTGNHSRPARASRSHQQPALAPEGNGAP